MELFIALGPKAVKQRSILILILLLVYGLSFCYPQLPKQKISLCLFRNFTGLPCAGCGLTRSFVAISHGDLKKAIRYHHFGPAIYLAGSLFLLKTILELIFRREYQSRRYNKIQNLIFWAFGVLLVLRWLIILSLEIFKRLS